MGDVQPRFNPITKNTKVLLTLCVQNRNMIASNTVSNKGQQLRPRNPSTVNNLTLVFVAMTFDVQELEF